MHENSLVCRLAGQRRSFQRHSTNSRRQDCERQPRLRISRDTLAAMDPILRQRFARAAGPGLLDLTESEIEHL